jgi:hypothetical protein
MLADMLAGSPADRYLITLQAGKEAGRQTRNDKGRQACRRQEKMQERKKIVQKWRAGMLKWRTDVQKERKIKIFNKNTERKELASKTEWQERKQGGEACDTERHTFRKVRQAYNMKDRHEERQERHAERHKR